VIDFRDAAGDKFPPQGMEALWADCVSPAILWQEPYRCLAHHVRPWLCCLPADRCIHFTRPFLSRVKGWEMKVR